MTRLLYAINVLFLCSGISFAAENHHSHDKNPSGQGQSCHENCKAQHPDVNSAEHKACMDQCAKNQK